MAKKDQDPFAEFGGEAVSQADTDPFAEFGGAINASEDDAFAEFGGMALGSGDFSNLPPAIQADQQGLETPTGAKLLENANVAGAGFFLPAVPGQLVRGAKAIKGMVSKVKDAKGAAAAAEIKPLADVAKAAPETPAVQQELPLAEEAQQMRMFEPTPTQTPVKSHFNTPGYTPPQDEIQRISYAIGQKYGGVSSHFNQFMEEASRIYSKDPKQAAKFIDEYVDSVTFPKGMSTRDAVGRGYKFPESVAGNIKADIKKALDGQDLLKPTPMGEQTDLAINPPAQVAPASGPQLALPPGKESVKALPPPSTIEGPGFTVTDPRAVQPSNLPQPERINKALLKQVRTKKFDNTLPERQVPEPPQSGSLGPIEQGRPTNPIQMPEQRAAQPELFSAPKSVFESKGASPAMKLSEAIQNNDLPDVLPAESMKRVAAIKKMAEEGKLNQIDPKNPLTDRLRFNEMVEGKGTGVFFEQGQALTKAVESSRRKTINEFKQLKQSVPFEAGSKESQAIQVFGEAPDKNLAMAELVAKFGKEKAEKISKSADYLRGRYDNYWVEVNKTRQANGQDLIPYRSDYFTHFKEMSILSDMGILGSASTKTIEKTMQQMKSAEEVLMQGRFARIRDVAFRFTRRIAGDDYTDDAVSGFKRYVSSANNYTEMQPAINELNTIVDTLQPTHPTVAKYLKDQANYLGGGLVGLDKSVADVIGPEFLRVYSHLTRNAVGNIVEGNPGIWMSQLLGEIPTFASHPIRDFATAAFKQATDPKLRALALTKSSVLRDRALDIEARNIDAGLVRKSLSAITSFLDMEVATHAWLTSFTNALRRGVDFDEAAKVAEVFAGKSQALTSSANTAPLLRSKTFQALAPLQNQSLAAAKYLAQDMWKGKDVTGKTLIAFKAAISATAAAIVSSAMFGHSKLTPTSAVPLGGTLEQGIGGPPLRAASGITKAINSGSPSGAAKAAMNALLLMQNKVPAGLMISKGINALMKEE
jgi:hypothetical protein